MSYEPQNDPANLEYQQVCRTWIRVMKTLREDNALLINRLAGALKETMCRSFVEKAEEFQLTMLDREEALILLRHEVGEQLAWLEQQPSGSPSPHQFAALTSDIEGMVREYERLRAAFLAFITAEKV